MMETTKSRQVIAVIREAECIGCTKCIQACPVDAIIGSAKLLHTVITAECIGCKLCVTPCPVDCIDLIPAEVPYYQTDLAKTRAQARKTREQAAKNQAASPIPLEQENKNAYIQAALLRARTKKNSG